MVDKALFSSAKDDWETPAEFYSELNGEFKFLMDSAATEFNTKAMSWCEDGLACEWAERTFCNPPYGRYITGKWVAKAAEEAAKGKLAVMLLPARTDTAWWHDYIETHATDKRFIRGRLAFEVNGEPMRDEKGRVMKAPFPSVVAVFDGRKKPWWRIF